MYKINSVNISQMKAEQKNKTHSSAVKNSINNNSLPQNSLSELIGRTQVNFRGGKDRMIELTMSDKKFINVIGKIFKLSEEEVNSIEEYTKDFFKKYKMRSFSAMKSDDIFEFANEQGAWAETVSRKLNLSDYEALNLDTILTTHIQTGDVTKFCNHAGETILDSFKYSTDYTPIRNVLEQNGVEESAIEDIISVLSSYSKNNKCGSIFDLFKKNNQTKADGTLTILLEDFGVSTDKISDILIDMHSLAGKNRKERIKGMNIHAIEEKFNDGLDTIVITGEIDKKFNTGITKELIELLEARKTDTFVHKDGKSLQEIAFYIADKYNLPKGADKEIINIIKSHSVPDSKEKIEKLIDTLKRDNGTNIQFL